MSRSLVGFVEQSVYVGFGLMCQAYTDRWYTTAWNMMKASDYQADMEKILCRDVFKGAANLADFRRKINKDTEMCSAVFSWEVDSGFAGSFFDAVVHSFIWMLHC